MFLQITLKRGRLTVIPGDWGTNKRFRLQMGSNAVVGGLYRLETNLKFTDKTMGLGFRVIMGSRALWATKFEQNKYFSGSREQENDLSGIHEHFAYLTPNICITNSFASEFTYTRTLIIIFCLQLSNTIYFYLNTQPSAIL